MKKFLTITSSSEVLGGKPCIRGTRISVELIMEWLSSGGTVEEIVKKHPKLTKSAVLEAIAYATR